MSALLLSLVAVATDPLLLPRTPAVDAVLARRFAGGCVSPDGAVVVLPEPGTGRPTAHLVLSTATGETVRTASGRLSGCLPGGALFVHAGGYAVQDYTTGAVVRSGTVALPTVAGECGAVSSELWPREPGFGYTLSLQAHPWRNGYPPGPDWAERIRCCLTGTVVVDDTGARFTVHDSASGPSVACAPVGFDAQRNFQWRYDPTLGQLEDEVALAGGGQLQIWADQQIVVRRVGEGGAIPWSRTFQQMPPPP